MKDWRRLILWIGAVTVILSTLVITLGIALVNTNYSPVNFHDRHPVISWAYFTALWLFFPSLLLCLAGGVLVGLNRAVNSK